MRFSDERPCGSAYVCAYGLTLVQLGASAVPSLMYISGVAVSIRIAPFSAPCAVAVTPGVSSATVMVTAVRPAVHGVVFDGQQRHSQFCHGALLKVSV